MSNIRDQVLKEAMDKIFPKEAIHTPDGKHMQMVNWIGNNLKEALALHESKILQLIEDEMKVIQGKLNSLSEKLDAEKSKWRRLSEGVSDMYPQIERHLQQAYNTACRDLLIKQEALSSLKEKIISQSSKLSSQSSEITNKDGVKE